MIEIVKHIPSVILILLGLSVLIILLFKLAVWARTGSRGAIILAAMLSFMTPDPIFEKNYKIVQESNKHHKRGDESGDPPRT